MVSVSKHVRHKVKVYGTPDERRKIRAGLDLMEKYGWNDYLPSVCAIKALDVVSHTAGPFVEGKDTCLEINVEPADLVDDVETALTIRHESYHTKRIQEVGKEALTVEEELDAHEKTAEDIDKALRVEERPRYMARLGEEYHQQEEDIE